MMKKYTDFQNLQNLVNDQALKQSDLFGQDSVLLDTEANRSYKIPLPSMTQ